jgi:hypothetical protein
MVRATELHLLKQTLRQIEPVLCEERQDGIEALLQMAMWINQVGQIRCVFGGTFITS